MVEALFARPTATGFLLVFLMVRVVMTLLSYGSGVPGGIFAPMLALGGLAGMCFGSVAHNVLPGLEMHPGAYALAAMGGLFAATVRAASV